jgi:hypothetical protein
VSRATYAVAALNISKNFLSTSEAHVQDITTTIDGILALIPNDVQYLSLKTRISNIRISIVSDPDRMLKRGADDLGRIIANMPPYDFKGKIDEYVAAVKANMNPPQPKAALPPPFQPQQQAEPTPPQPAPPAVPMMPQLPQARGKIRAFAWMATPKRIGVITETGVTVAEIEFVDGQNPLLIANAATENQYEIEWVQDPMHHQKFMDVMGYKAAIPPQVQEKPVERPAPPPPDTVQENALVGKLRIIRTVRAEIKRLQKQLEIMEEELYAGV